MRNCKLCRLHKTRTNVVPGEGPIDTKIMLVGEAPGFNEDKQGRPFVGAAGQLLTELLKLAGIDRSSVYITNVVKCRPPGNREPMADEIDVCTREYLEKQFAVIRPELVISLGRISASELLGYPVSISREHGKIMKCQYAGVSFRLFLSYHPAAGLYGAQVRSVLEEDFKKLSKTLDRYLLV